MVKWRSSDALRTCRRRLREVSSDRAFTCDYPFDDRTHDVRLFAASDRAIEEMLMAAAPGLGARRARRLMSPSIQTDRRVRVYVSVIKSISAEELELLS